NPPGPQGETVTFRQSLRRRPELSPTAIFPFIVGAALLVVSLVGMQLRTDYLVQRSWSKDALFVADSTFSPVWEESLKVGLGLVLGFSAVTISALFMWIGPGHSARSATS